MREIVGVNALNGLFSFLLITPLDVIMVCHVSTP